MLGDQEFSDSFDYESNLATQPDKDSTFFKKRDPNNSLLTENTEAESFDTNLANAIEEMNDHPIHVPFEGKDFCNDENNDESYKQFDLRNIVATKFPLIKSQFWREERFLLDFLQHQKHQFESILRTSLRKFGFIDDDDQQRSKSIATQNNEGELHLQSKISGTLSLHPLCIKRIWKIRECSHLSHLQTQNKVEDDGPLSLVYHKVLSLQVKVNNNYETMGQIESHTEAPYIIIFFYNQYAQKLSSILQPNMVLKLRNIPSASVFPSSSSSFNFENYMNKTKSVEIIANEECIPSPCTICIGGESKLDFIKKGKKYRFDENIQISVESGTSRWIISSETYLNNDKNSGQRTQEEFKSNTIETSEISNQNQHHIPPTQPKRNLDHCSNDDASYYNSVIEEHIKMIENGNINKNTNQNGSKRMKTNNGTMGKSNSTYRSSNKHEISPSFCEYKIDTVVYHYLVSSMFLIVENFMI